MQGTLLFLLISAVYIASAVPIAENEIKKEYPRFIEFPDGEGNMHKVDLEAEPDYEFLKTRNANNNVYLLFTRRNQILSQTLRINDANSIRNSNFNAAHQTVVIVHGWLSNQHTNPNPTVRNVYLRKGEANVIVMDWRDLAAADYATAVRGVPDVGRGLGRFLIFLNSVTGAPFNSMHIIGFSLGAHIVGNAGRELGGRAARVTGLDPAGPLWQYNANRLRPSDAVYVEAIHTDGSYTGLGIGSAIANADFFPNGGNSQPGCLTSFCNHNRAWEFFAATVTYNHLVGNLCDNTVQITWNTCRGRQFHMGNDDLRKSGTGMYRLNTASRYPY